MQIPNIVLKAHRKILHTGPLRLQTKNCLKWKNTLCCTLKPSSPPLLRGPSSVGIPSSSERLWPWNLSWRRHGRCCERQRTVCRCEVTAGWNHRARPLAKAVYRRASQWTDANWMWDLDMPRRAASPVPAVQAVERRDRPRTSNTMSAFFFLDEQTGLNWRVEGVKQQHHCNRNVVDAAVHLGYYGSCFTR